MAETQHQAIRPGPLDRGEGCVIEAGEVDPFDVSADQVAERAGPNGGRSDSG